MALGVFTSNVVELPRIAPTIMECRWPPSRPTWLGAPTPLTRMLLSMVRVEDAPNCRELLSTSPMVSEEFASVEILSCSRIGIFVAAAIVAPARWIFAVP